MTAGACLAAGAAGGGATAAAAAAAKLSFSEPWRRLTLFFFSFFFLTLRMLSRTLRIRLMLGNRVSMDGMKAYKKSMAGNLQ